MATCCFSSLQDPPPPRGTWWTPPARTHLHRSRPPLPPPHPRPCPSRARCQRLRSRRTRSTSIWPSRTARSTGIKTLSCERQACQKPPHLKASFSDCTICFCSLRCRHGALGKCVHCVPLEVGPFSSVSSFVSSRLVSRLFFLLTFYFQPFDEDYLNHLDPPVKHMSFHAYLRKLTGGADK